MGDGTHALLTNTAGDKIGRWQLMRQIFLDTNVWSHMVRAASRPDRRQFVDGLHALGLALGWSVELVREVGRTTDIGRRRETAAAIVELSGEHGLIEPNHVRFGSELCAALGRDHPDWIEERLTNEEKRYANAYRAYLWGLVRGNQGEPATADELAALAGDAEIHRRLSVGDFVARPTKTLVGLTPEKILDYVRNAPRQTHVNVPVSARERRSAIAISSNDFEMRVKLQLLNDLIIEAFDNRVDENDGRRFVTERLSAACDAEAFTRWVWLELRREDVPSYRIAMAASLGQALRRHQGSNLYDRDHAELLTRVRLLVTADGALGAVLNHPKLRTWIPSHHLYVRPREVRCLDTLLRRIEDAVTAT